MMGLELNFFRAEATRVSALVPKSKWFIFGSLVQNSKTPEDIDLLVICPSSAEVDLVRRELAKASCAMPLHLMLLSEAEEREIEFVERQKCEPFFEWRGLKA